MAAPKSVRGYDKESGVVYTDVVVPLHSMRNKYGSSWAHESPFLHTRRKNTASAGANSLKIMAIRRVLSDQRVLAADHFEAVPWRIAEYLWNFLLKSRKATLYMWKLLATVYPKEFGQLEPHYRFKPASKSLFTGDYLKLLISDSSKWLTVLDLPTSFVDSLPDLTAIVEITNLVALKIASPSKAASSPSASAVTLTDRILRTWSEHVLTHHSFRHLAILAVSQQLELTDHVFTYLDNFEALRFFLVQGCPRFAQKSTRNLAEAHGWEVCIEPHPEEDFYKYVKTLLDDTSQEFPMEISSRPILEFSPMTQKREKAAKSYTIIFKREQGFRPPLQSHSGPKTEAVINRAANRVTKPERKPVLKSNVKKHMRALLGQFSKS